MTLNEAVKTLQDMKPIIKASYNTRKWVDVEHVPVDRVILLALESYGLVDVKAGLRSNTVFRAKAAAIKAVE